MIVPHSRSKDASCREEQRGHLNDSVASETVGDARIYDGDGADPERAQRVRVGKIGGVDAMQERFGEHVVKAHLPPPGTPTQPIEGGYLANAWVVARHPDFDTLHEMLDTIGRTVRLHAA